MAKKEIVIIVFGEEAVDAYYDCGLKGLQAAIENGDGRVVKREFNTKEEADAYLLGIDDMDGWLAYETIEEDDINNHQKIINKLIK